jgi:hypothetical protein
MHRLAAANETTCYIQREALSALLIGAVLASNLSGLSHNFPVHLRQNLVNFIQLINAA